MNKINFSKLENMSVNQSPYPYAVIDNVFLSDQEASIKQSLPEVDLGGSVPLDTIDIQPALQALLDDLRSDAFRKVIERKFDIDLANHPSMITYRACARNKDGRIHTDSKSKLITVLIYLNESWPHQAGRLRILNDGDNLENYVDEVTPLFGRCVIFKVTDNCWHGHYPINAQRRAIQFNFVTTESSKSYQHYKHRLSSVMKRLKKLFS